MLSIVATPIGNLEDITLRAIETLKLADIIVCEDTRVTKKLLLRLSVNRPLMSYHQHSGGGVVQRILELLQAGKQVALVTDAGTPGISDPGNELVRQLTMNNEQITITPIPGPSAVTAALSVSGFPTDKFLFLGFPPHKKRRQQFFMVIAEAPYTVVLYESCHRIKKTLNELSAHLAPTRELCMTRELTKVFETIYRGTMTEMQAMQIPEKGEFVIVIDKK